MRKLAPIIALAVLLFTAGCTSVCTSVTDKPACEVSYYISLADQIDTNLKALVTGIPTLPASVIHAVNAYHSALPSAEQAARDALAAYEAGKSSDYTSAVNFLVALYTDVSKVVVAAGQPDPVKTATATVTAVK